MGYVTSLEEILWGGTLVAITMVIHGCGMILTLDACGLLGHSSDETRSFARRFGVLILASWMIVLVHLVEVTAWAAFFVWQEAMPDASTAYFFSLMQYTAVGSGFQLPLRWRLLEGLLPIAGLMTFAWSTGVLFTLAQDFQSQELRRIRERRKARHAKGRSHQDEDTEQST